MDTFSVTTAAPRFVDAKPINIVIVVCGCGYRYAAKERDPSRCPNCGQKRGYPLGQPLETK